MTLTSDPTEPVIVAEQTRTFALPYPHTAGIMKDSLVVENQPKRRVSIASDQGLEHRLGLTGAYDNPSYESSVSKTRKISQISLPGHMESGPMRRKSILTNAGPEIDCDHSSIYSDNRSCKNNTLENQHDIYPKISIEHQSDGFHHIERSWLYNFCLKCRGGDEAPTWEPPFWQKLFPYPLCPNFRQFSRLATLIFIGILIWITAYVIIGDSAAPGGQLFGLVVLTVAANFGGYLISLMQLPRLIGMLFVGIIFQNVGWVSLDGDITHVTSHLRKFALTIILTRAGLEMEPDAFRKVYKTILKLGVIPWFTEGLVMAISTHFLLNLPWMWSFLLGSIVAAVSPAVVVPCLFRLRTKGYGVAKGIPTLIVAVAGIDDALSVALFGIISSILFSENGSMAYIISQAPVCVIGGLGFGVVWGNMARIFPEKGDPYVVPLRTILLFAGGLVAIYGSDKIGYEGAGPLAVVFSAFISNLFWCKQGWEVDDNPVGTAFEIFWMIFEPILFGLTGSTVKIWELEGDLVYTGVGCLCIGIIIRIFCTAGIAFGDRLNTKEKFFVALSWMSKATVQAALGPVALRSLKPDASDALKEYANIVQTISVLSIVLTAPIGAILISVTGTKLLNKTKQPPQVLEGWRRSHRPSIRDISIIDEEEEKEDPETPQLKINGDLAKSIPRLNNSNIYTVNK